MGTKCTEKSGKALQRTTGGFHVFRLQKETYVDKGIPDLYWDNGSRGKGRECSGIVDHATGEYISNGEEIVNVMRTAYFGN